MGLFTRKKKDDDKKAKEQMKKKYSYRVTICDPLGKSPRELKEFGANKSRGDDGIVWLVNEQEDFEEIFPLDHDITSNESLNDIEKAIKATKEKKVLPHENPLNKEEKLLKLEKIKQSILNPDGSFIKIDRDGVPHLIYVRYRTAFVPMKWNLDFGRIHTPVEHLLKNALIKEREKKDKYLQKNQGIFTTGMIIWGVILLVWTGVMAYYSTNWFDKVDQSKVQEINNRIDDIGLLCIERWGQASENFVTASEYSVNITGSLYDRLNPNIDTQVPTENIR